LHAAEEKGNIAGYLDWFVAL